MSHPAASALGFVPDLSLRVFGMRRSGNHAILNWLARNGAGGRSVFLNNCRPGRHPFDSFAAIEVNRERRPIKPAQKNLALTAGEAGDGAVFLVSYEDFSPAEKPRRTPEQAAGEDALFDRDVLISRSFLNWAASLLRKIQPNPDYSVLSRVTVMLRSLSIYGRMLDLVAEGDTAQRAVIRYDDWVSDEVYRAARLDTLGLALRDNSLGEVQSYGGGSSFQKDAKTPQDLSTLDRWRDMAQDPEFQAVLLVAARDCGFLARLERVYPQDAACLAPFATKSLLPEGFVP